MPKLARSSAFLCYPVSYSRCRGPARPLVRRVAGHHARPDCDDCGAALSATVTLFLIAVGRLLCGMGAIVVTVVMTKVVIDWFAQHEMATAMGIFLAGYPAGMGLALVTLGPLATAEDWRLGLYACASLSFVCLLVFWVTYRRSAPLQTRSRRAQN